MDTGNLLLGGMFVAPFLGDRGFDWRLAVTGVVGWIALFGLACGLLYHRRGEHI